MAAVVVVLVVALAASGDAAGEGNSSFADIQRILDKKTLVVAVIDRDVPPLIVASGKGELSGFDVDLARQIAQALGVEVVFNRDGDTPDGVVDLVAAGKADIAVSFVSATPRRAMRVLLSRPYLTQGETFVINRVSGISFRRKCPTVDEFVEFGKWRGVVGAIKNSSFAARLAEALDGTRFREFNTFKDMMWAMQNGEIAMSYQGELVARRFLEDNPAYRVRLRVCTLGGARDQIAVAVRPDAPNLRAFVNSVLDDRRISLDVKDLLQRKGLFGF